MIKKLFSLASMISFAITAQAGKLNGADALNIQKFLFTQAYNSSDQNREAFSITRIDQNAKDFADGVSKLNRMIGMNGAGSLLDQLTSIKNRLAPQASNLSDALNKIKIEMGKSASVQSIFKDISDICDELADDGYDEEEKILLVKGAMGVPNTTILGAAESLGGRLTGDPITEQDLNSQIDDLYQLTGLNTATLRENLVVINSSLGFQSEGGIPIPLADNIKESMNVTGRQIDGTDVIPNDDPTGPDLDTMEKKLNRVSQLINGKDLKYSDAEGNGSLVEPLYDMLQQIQQSGYGTFANIQEFVTFVCNPDLK